MALFIQAVLLSHAGLSDALPWLPDRGPQALTWTRGRHPRTTWLEWPLRPDSSGEWAVLSEDPSFAWPPAPATRQCHPFAEPVPGGSLGSGADGERSADAQVRYGGPDASCIRNQSWPRSASSTSGWHPARQRRSYHVFLPGTQEVSTPSPLPQLGPPPITLRASVVIPCFNELETVGE